LKARPVHHRSALLVVGVFVCAFFAIQAFRSPSSAGDADLRAVRQNVREAGSYRFAAEMVQSLIPIAAP
jgi:hypothetical protein